MEKQMKLKRGLLAALALVGLALLIIPISDAVAKYISTKTADSEVTAALFVATGDYAEKIPEGEAPPNIKVSDWQNDIVLTLYNYDGEQISLVDIEYTVTVPEGWSVAADADKLPQGEKTSVKIRLIPPANARKGDKVSFTLETEPYSLTMQAVFELTDSPTPDHTVKDMGDYILLTVRTNNYSGSITVNYNGAVLAPDSTNELMRDWKRTDPGGSFDAEPFTEYQLIFFEEQSINVNETTGSGSVIELPASNT